MARAVTDGYRKRTIPEVSEETLRLQTYVEKFPDGEELSFERITHDTGIQMNNENKAHLRTACKRAKREYSSIRGYGIRLADVASVRPILTNKLVKVDRCVYRAEKSHVNLYERFFHSLPKEDQRDILFIGACFGAIRVAAENGKRLFGKVSPKQLPSDISIDYQSIPYAPSQNKNESKKKKEEDEEK